MSRRDHSQQLSSNIEREGSTEDLSSLTGFENPTADNPIEEAPPAPPAPPPAAPVAPAPPVNTASLEDEAEALIASAIAGVERLQKSPSRTEASQRALGYARDCAYWLGQHRARLALLK